MYVNYLTLSLVAVAATLLLGAWYVLRGEAVAEDRRAYAYAFGAAGSILTVTGLHISLTWPIPGQHNIAFGEPLAYFGILLVIGSIALARDVKLGPLAFLGAIGGAANLVIAAAILQYGLTLIPTMAAAMFGTSGFGALLFPLRARSRLLRLGVVATLFISGALFALTTFRAYPHHLAPGSFDAWTHGPPR